MAAMLELSRMLGLAALVLGFAGLAVRRAWFAVYLAQLAAVALAALCQAVLQGDAAVVLVAVILAAQGALLWRDRPASPVRAAFPAGTLGAAVVLVMLALAVAPGDAMAAPLAIVLLGLLAAANVPGPCGLLSLANGVVLAMVLAPGLPLRPLMVLGLVAAVLWVARDGRLALPRLRR